MMHRGIVVNQTQHQHRKATQALRQAKENRAASTAKYLAHAAPQILPTQRTAVQPLRDSAGGNIVEEQHHWLLQSMQLTGQLQQLQQPAAPAGRDSLAVSGTSAADAGLEKNHRPVASKVSSGKRACTARVPAVGRQSGRASKRPSKFLDYADSE